LPSTSIKSRFAVTLLSNVLRAGLSFVTGLAVARGLGPEGYGDFAFLLGSFAAVKQLLDMGSANAFYTFLSRRPRGKRFLASYVAWQAAQLVLTALVLAAMPGPWISSLWATQPRDLVMLALLASFLQQQAWQTLSQIGDAQRLTRRVQYINLGVAFAHLVVVVTLWRMALISVELLFAVLIAEYLVALVAGYRLLWRPYPASREPLGWRELARDYWEFCQPLLLYSWLSFAYAFSDTWLLRTFGGAEQQAYFSIASQFAAVSLIATTAMNQIFWKEIAEAHQNGDLERMAELYRKVSQSLFMVAALASGFLIPWSEEITLVTLGPNYAGGAAVLGLMLLYPIHQSMGQIGGTMFYATGKTKPQVAIGMIAMAASIPAAYFVQAPTDAVVPGLAAGAMGMALKMIVLQVLAVNAMAWWIARSFGWKFAWEYQVAGVAGALLCGWAACRLGSAVAEGAGLGAAYAFVLAGAIYLLAASAFLWAMPWVAGWQRAEIRMLLRGLPFGWRRS
jgi:O-antigen/teichoic acid export membrane protein